MKFRIATFNAANLVLPNINYYKNNRYSKKDYEKKIKWISNQLKKMDADIVGFQEVFHKEALLEAVKKSGVYDENTEVILLDENGHTPNCAIVSRFPVLSSELIYDYPDKSVITMNDSKLPLNRFRHPVLKSNIKLPNGFTTNFYITHLKSKRPLKNGIPIKNDEVEFAISKARSLFQRSSEACALRNLIINDLRTPRTPVVVMGDLNDSVNSVTTRLITGDQPLDRFSHSEKIKIWNQLLYSTYDIQLRQSDRDIYYTHIHNGKHESLDHILVSQDFFHLNPKRIGQVRYMRLLNDHIFDRTLTEEKLSDWSSDHGQVFVSIELL